MFLFKKIKNNRGFNQAVKEEIEAKRPKRSLRLNRWQGSTGKESRRY
jgi:hypothetical protein